MRIGVVAALGSVAVLGVALGAGCGGGTTTDHLRVEDGPLRRGNGITPAQLTVHQGHAVAITVTNTDIGTTHGFSIEGYGITKTIQPGTTITVTFQATTAGTYRVFCQLHRRHKPAELTVR
jgi:nitrosocyanin